MFEDRVIRFSALETSTIAEPKNPQDRFAEIRGACRSVVSRLPPADQPTLVLLTAADIENGILECLLNLQLQSTTETEDLAAQIIEIAERESHLLVAICMPQESLQAWDAPCENSYNNKDQSIIKDKEFLIRLFISYQLGFAIPGVRNSNTDASRVYSQIERSLKALDNAPRLDGWRYRQESAKRDICVLTTKVLSLLCPEIVANLDDGGSRERNARFLHVISRLDQFGKRPAGKIMWSIGRDIEKLGLRILDDYRYGSYGLRQELDHQLKAPKPSVDRISKLIGQLQAYRLFRDSARWLGDGAFPWARSWARSRSRPFVALFIDENLLNPDEAALRARIVHAFSMLFQENGFELNAITCSDGVLPTDLETRQIGESIVGIDRFFEDAFTHRICKAEWPDTEDGNGSKQWQFSEMSKKRLLHDYDAIFCEVDYRNRFAGPQVVQKLTSYLERTAAASGKLQLPALIVLTQMDNFGHVQQCLNLGAHAFVNKQRMFQIPSRLQRASEDVRPTHGNGTPVKRERSGQHSNFRTLFSLRPDRMAFLRSLDLKQRVVGGWSEERSLSANGARRRYRHLANFDAQDRDWIRSLPKADLHCHFGTSISLLTVEALAFNTCGHLFTNWTHADVDPEMVPAGVGVLIKDICSIVKRAVFDIAHDPNGIRDKPPAEFFYLAMEKTLEPRGRRPTGRIPSDPYGEVVKALMLKNPPVKDYIIVSLLVAVNACLRRETIDEILQEWQYFEQLHEWCHKLDAERNTGAWIQTAVIRAARLAVQCVDTIIHSIGPVRTIEDSWTTPRNQNVSLVQAGALWQKWHENIQHRVRAAHAIIVRFLAESPPFSPPREAAPTLEELVALPKHPAPDDHSLLRYFWGCSLLGAEHLQYPENVILGAHDLVRQNVKDWVIYTEVRCETPGYSRTGMSSELVTDLLCASFDMAAVFERDYHKGPLIRTNVLLAAKRHKSTEEIEKVVSLLARYLTRSRVFPPDLYRGLPGWWKPAQVVGFDLSGKEDENPKGLPQQIARLIELSSPITIHAGEAASAESIWRAVYLHHARRIGHGVRLREQAKLLQFCINEGICMEMCPVSNIFTSDFIIAGDQNAPENKYDPRRIEHYPLRHFMDCGLEVCINTDNRSLHGAYGGTLTDEYLWAAALSGGFTRWEVLRLIKAGFKHAFIDKSDVQELLQAVEYWIFANIANAPGLDWQAGLPDEIDH